MQTVTLDQILKTQLPSGFYPNEDQARAVFGILEWLPGATALCKEIRELCQENPFRSEEYFPRVPRRRVWGLAGTGKTTVSAILPHFGVRVIYVAFTNRAVTQLINKGSTPSKTLHSLMYAPAEHDGEVDEEQEAIRAAYLDAVARGVPVEERPEMPKELGEVSFSYKEHSGGKSRPPHELYDLIVVDEASMVGNKLGQDLLRLRIPILAVGDHGQLLPVGDTPFFPRENPESMLTKVERTDTDILDLAMFARKGNKPSQWNFINDIELTSEQEEDKHFVAKGEAWEVRRKAKPEWFEDVDQNGGQIICGIHDKRRDLNAHVRKLKGFVGIVPQVGEKLITVANNHERQMFNGTLWIVDRSERMGDYVQMDLVEYAPTKSSELLEYRRGIWVHLACFQKDIVGPQDVGIATFPNSVLMTWGYAITCHKSQGSEFPVVMVFDDSAVFKREAANWAYTAYTRAKNRCWVISRN